MVDDLQLFALLFADMSWIGTGPFMAPTTIPGGEQGRKKKKKRKKGAGAWLRDCVGCLFGIWLES